MAFLGAFAAFTAGVALGSAFAAGVGVAVGVFLGAGVALAYEDYEIKSNMHIRYTYSATSGLGWVLSGH